MLNYISKWYLQNTAYIPAHKDKKKNLNLSVLYSQKSCCKMVEGLLIEKIFTKQVHTGPRKPLLSIHKHS